jgi:hypothetical protein
LLITYNHSKPLQKSGVACLDLPCGYDLVHLHQSELSWEEIKIDQMIIPVLMVPGSKHEIPFDLLATIYFHLTRMEEIAYQKPEEVDGEVMNQLLYRYGQFKIPVVDVLCNWFAGVLEKKTIPLLKKAIYPSGQQCGIALTHDVDRIYAMNPVKKWFLKQSNRLKPAAKQRNELLDQADERIWIFNKLFLDYQHANFKPTIFFLAKRMENSSYRYNIRAKKFHDLLQRMHENNFEIALHASRYAFDYRKRYAAEKKRLGAIMGPAIRGLRQHYIRCLFPDLWRIASDCGFLYDSSLIHRRMSGFRGGTGHPFYCFDHQQGRVLPLTECPPIFFENTLPDEGNDLEKSLAEVLFLFGQIKKYRGVMVALWHQHNIYDNEPYPEIWRTFLSSINPAQMYVDTLAGQARWYDHRNKIYVTEVAVEKNNWRLILELPSELSAFALVLPDRVGHLTIQNPNIEYRIKGNLVCITLIKEARLLELKLEYNL